MKLSDWASIAEIFGAVAIVVSLVFVGLQIRDNTVAIQAATYQEHLGYELNLLTTAASDSGLAENYAIGSRGGTLDGLEGSDVAKTRWLWLATYRLYEGFYLQYLRGTLSTEDWESRRQVAEEFLSYPMACQFANGIAFGGEFRDYILEVNENC